MTNYLVTGVAGFIGHRVAEFLLQNGDDVFGVENFSTAYDVRLKRYRLSRLNKFDRFRFLEIDIAEKENLARIADFIPSDTAAIINLAAWAGVRKSLKDPWVYIDTNITGTLNMLELCRRQHIKKFVLASSSSLYGENTQPPFKETDDTLHPLQPYAATKIGAETMAHAYHHLFDIDITVLRYFTVYGPAGRPDMVMFRFCKWIAEGDPVIIFGDGEQSRGFTYLDDIARGTILSLKPVGYEVINLGGHEVITINQLIHKLEERLGKKARITYEPFNAADVRSNQADVSKAAQVLDWHPEINLDQGISRLVDWYVEERSWARDIKLD
ncbi:GDP-mannose 4,6-dehydratase [bacterium]|nr:GDP-mannose 4,6-dehydratase [bacterium]